MTALLTWRYLSEYARRPLNLVLLATIPVIFVTLSAGAIADFARILGGTAGLGQLEVATAGWAAAFLAGVSGFFHVAGSREPDRRLAGAGSATGRVVTARLISSLALAGVATAGALIALGVRTEIADIGRTVGATVMFALIYMAIGATIGALVRSELNGSLLIVLIWIFDVFFGPAMGRTEAVVTRLFPSHYPTLVVLDAATTHGGPFGDLGVSLAWTTGSLAMALLAMWLTTRPFSSNRLSRPINGFARVRSGLRHAWKEYRRHTALWVLLVIIPILFISLSIGVTPDDPAPVELVEEGQEFIAMLSMADIHGAIMIAITVAFLAGLAGLFVVLGSTEGDRRLVLAGFRPREVLASRLGVIALAALLVTGVSLAVTSVSFQPEVWATFGVATLGVAVIYAMIGVVVGPLVGKLGGLYLMFILTFLDLGLAQNVMFDAAPPTWGAWMPGRGAMRVLIDGAFTPGFDETSGLLMALGWLAGLTIAAMAVFHRTSAPVKA